MTTTHSMPVEATRRRALPRSAAYALAAYVVGLSLFAALTPSPLYQGYGEHWGLSPLTITLIYATYAVGILITLLLAGRISDEIGRRPVLLVSLGALLVSTVLFILAASPAWLFVARGLQGLATGAAISAASAALIDLHPRRDPFGAGLANAVASSAGIALGILVTSVLVQLGRLPLVLPYVVLFGLIVVAIAGAYWMPESVTGRRKLRLTLQWPHVPSSVRRPFAVAGLTALASWSLGGLFFSLGPALAARLFDSSNTVVTGLGIVALGATATLSQLALGRTAPWLGAMSGSIALAVGVILIVLATAGDSGAIYIVGSAIAGFGFGIGFLGGLRGLVSEIPTESRASVMSAFYIVAYASLSVPAVLAGLVVGALGVEATFEAFGLVIVLIASITSIVAWRGRPPLAMPRAA